MSDQFERITADELVEIQRRWKLRHTGRVMSVYGQAELFREWLDHVAGDETALLATVDLLQADLDMARVTIESERARHEAYRDEVRAGIAQLHARLEGRA